MTSCLPGYATLTAALAQENRVSPGLKDAGIDD